MLRWRWIAGLLLIAGLAACGTSDAPDPAKVVDDAAQAFDAVKTVQFAVAVTEGTSAPLNGIEVISADGVSERPDKLQTKLKARMSGTPLAVNVNLIIIGGDAWITPNPFNPQQYEKMDDTGGLETFSPIQGVGDVLRGLRNLSYVAEEDVDGTASHHIKGVADATALQAITGGVASAGELQLDLWIGKDDLLMRKLLAVGPLDPSEKPGITRTISFSAFNAAVTIAPPQ